MAGHRRGQVVAARAGIGAHPGDDSLQLQRTMPRTAVVVLSQYLQRRYAIELLADQSAGVGYLLKQRIADVPTFCGDLRRVCAAASCSTRRSSP